MGNGDHVNIYIQAYFCMDPNTMFMYDYDHSSAFEQLEQAERNS